MVELSKLVNGTGKINQMLFLTIFPYMKKNRGTLSETKTAN